MALSIGNRFGDGQKGLSRGTEGGDSQARDILQGLVDDVASVQATVIASTDATDLASAITLVNEIKAALNAIAALTMSVTKT